MKKIFIILLTISMLFGLVSCFNSENNNEHTVHTDENKDGLCDGCQGIFVDYSEPTLVGKALKRSIEKQFDEAKSLKIDFQLRFVRDYESWNFEEYYDSDLGTWVETEEIEHDTEYTEGIANIEILLSIDDDGVDAKMTATPKSRNSATEEFTIEDPETVYIIDGYSYSPSIDGYYRKDSAIPENLTNILEQLGDFSIDDEKKNELLEALSIEVATIFNIKDNQGSFSFDAKPGIDKVLNYLKNLDMENDTLAKVLDDVLKEISPDLTTAKIVDALESVAGSTVTEVLDELDRVVCNTVVVTPEGLDDGLAENRPTTLQDIYDYIIADPDVYSIIEALVAMANDLDPAFADDKEAIDAIMAEIKAFDIRKAVEDAGIGDTVIFDIISRMLPPVSTDPETNESVYITKDELFGAVREFLALNLTELEESTGMTLFSTLKELASAVTLNRLNGKLDLNFVGALELSTVVAEFNFDIEVDVESDVEGKINHQGIVLEVDFTVSDISKESVKVTLPAGSKVLPGELTAENAEIDVYYYDYDDELTANLYFDIIDESGRTMEISAYDVSIDELEKGTVTVKVDGLYYDSYYYYYFDVDQDFVFRIDLQAGTVTIVTLPDITKAENY